MWWSIRKEIKQFGNSLKKYPSIFIYTENLARFSCNETGVSVEFHRPSNNLYQIMGQNVDESILTRAEKKFLKKCFITFLKAKAKDESALFLSKLNPPNMENE